MRRRRFSSIEANNGELAIRMLSEKAQYVLYNTDPRGIFEVCEEDEKRYYVTGGWEIDDVSLEELDKELCEIYDMYLKDDESDMK